MLPGDVSASKRYWKRDIIQPPVETTPRGTIEVRDEPGFGYALDHEFIREPSRSGEESRSVEMAEFCSTLLRDNRNYRYTWIGQVVSEVGDHFNNIAVFSLALATTKSGLVVTGVMLSRAIPAMLAGPLAGVVLDRLDRKRIMIASDLIRAVVALGFILTVHRHDTWLLYVLSALLMFASPFFTSGRAAILPTIATDEELHTANSLTQTTQWTTLTIGAFLGGASVTQFGYDWAFAGQRAVVPVLGALHLAPAPAGPRLPAAARRDLTEAEVVRPWHEYIEGLRYMRAVAADPGHRADQQSAGPPAAARRRSCSAFSARSFSTAARPASAYLWAFGGHRPADRRRHWRTRLGRASQFRKPTSAPSASATWCTADRTSSSARRAASRWRCCSLALSRAGRRSQLGAEHVAVAAARLRTNFAAACSRPWNRSPGRP